MSASDSHANDIVIVGMAARLPGAPTVRDYWRNLREGVESVRWFRDEELRAAGVSEEHLTHPRYVKASPFLEQMEWFDAEFFGFSPKEAAILDPQHRHFLECAWEALEDAGHVPERFPGRVGVFGGCGMGSYLTFNLLSNPDLVESVGLFLLRHTGNDKDFLCTRVSYLFNLTGPSIGIQTACSTSLVAVHAACQSLLSGESDLALAGGVTIELPHYRGYLYQEGEILSPDGHCRAFDHRAQGTLFGSGVGIVVLRRLADALEDRDHIYAVIRGSAVNNDGGAKVGYLAPSVSGQAAAVTEALAVADVSPESISYIECHGTGTAMGDPIEVAALTEAFRHGTARKGYCGLGSVKTNIGHLDTAAGVASLIKVAQALEHETLPATLNYSAPNPSIDFDNSPFFVNHELKPWPRSREPRRAGVNSLGVGGTNAHVIVEEAPLPAASDAPARPCVPLCWSARNRAALDDYAQKLASFFQAHPDVNLADVAWSLQFGRKHFPQRRVLSATSVDEAIALLESHDAQRVFTHKAEEQSPSVVFAFPGGGSQYPAMGAELYRHEPVIREWFDRGFAALKSWSDFDLRQLWLADEAQHEDVRRALEQSPIQLPAIYMLEYALAQLWQSWGIRPAAMIGHSLGEVTAWAVSGAISFEDGLRIVLVRGQLLERVSRGGMLSIPMSAERVQPLLGAELDLAAINAPELCAVAGPVSALEALQTQLAEQGIEAKRVPIAIAAHSRMLEPVLSDYGREIRRCRLQAPQIPFISNRTGTWITPEQATDPEYWVQHFRNTVRFADGVGTLLETPGRVFLEVGPGRTLSSLIRQHSRMKPGQPVFNSLRHPEERISDEVYLQTVLGRLWAVGVDFDREAFWQGESRRRIPLPTYAFQRQRYFIEPGRQATAPREDHLRPARTADPLRWYWEPVWKESPLGSETLRSAPSAGPVSPPADGEAPGPWLVFQDETGLGNRLVASLRRQGRTVITVQQGDTYHRRDEQSYVLSPEQGREGYDLLIRDLVAHGQVPERVVHGWLVTADERHRPGSSYFHRNQECGFYSLLFLAQAWSNEGVAHPLALTVLTNRMQRVNQESTCDPEKSLVMGPVQVIPHEFPGAHAGTVDLDLPHRSRGRKAQQAWEEQLLRQVSLVERELAAPAGDVHIAYRASQRWAQAYEPVRWPAAHKPLRARERGVYLITGGLGGIGLALAEHLARSVQARLVLLSRRHLPARAAWDTWLATHPLEHPTSKLLRRLRAMEALGAEVLPLQADVTDVEDVRGALETAQARFGPLHGVIHAAGVMQDNVLAAKTLSEVNEVMSPKVEGTLVLHEALAQVPLDWLVLCSSTSSVVSPAGQVDYVAANAFLNAYAQSQAARTTPRTIALQWGVWNDVGMAASAAERLGGSGTPDAPPEPARHPWLTDRRGTVHAERVLLHAAFSTSTHWLLDEHRTAAGDALVPGTGYLELSRAALAELDVAAPFAIEDLLMVRPLQVADGALRDVRLKLLREEQGYAFEVQSRVTLPDGRSGWETHAQASLALGNIGAPPSVPLDAVRARCQARPALSDREGLRLKQENHLAFGPRWRVLQRVDFGQAEALAALVLPERFAGDLATMPLHPGVLDLATGFALELVPGYDRCDDLWVPVSYKRVRVWDALPVRLWSWARSRDQNRADGEFVRFDITLCDETGRVVVEIEDYTMRRLAAGNEFALVREAGAGELELDAVPAGDLSRQLSPSEQAFRHNLRLGITEAEGTAAFDQVLASAAGPQVIVTPIPVDALALQMEQLAEQAQATPSAAFERPRLDSEFIGPRDSVEKTLVGFWEELLGVQTVGVRDNFFELGGHSLIAVRLFGKIKKAFQVQYPISVLFEAPTIEQCANLLRSSGNTADEETAAQAAPRYKHLVAMHEGSAGHKTPFFIVAGMFGNVLNLRHLAHLVGSDRPCYGLQARGLFGEDQPHETFEEMARDYLRELRNVQPHGPYLLGGFSGGGIAAFEMAQQLREAGEEVALLVMLDTYLPFGPSMTRRDKLQMHVFKLLREGPGYIRERLEVRRAWKQALHDKEQARAAGVVDADQFHSLAIEAAFLAAADRYRVRPYPGAVMLLRPKQRPYHVFGPGRMINAERRFIFPDNGWTPYVGSLRVQEVPGDHDSMVLEPNVRVLSARLRRAIEDVELGFGSPPILPSAGVTGVNGAATHGTVPASTRDGEPRVVVPAAAGKAPGEAEAAS